MVLHAHDCRNVHDVKRKPSMSKTQIERVGRRLLQRHYTQHLEGLLEGQVPKTLRERLREVSPEELSRRV